MNWKLIPKDASTQPKTGHYGDWKEQIAAECFNQCIYCSINEMQFGGIDHYHIEHYKPKSIPRFSVLIDDILNLYYACPICNRFKNDDWPNDAISLDIICYPDPSQYNYSELFAVDMTSFKLSGNYVSSKYITQRLFLNRPQLIYERREQILKDREKLVRAELEILRKSNVVRQDNEALNSLLDGIEKLGHTLDRRLSIRPYKLAEIRK